MNRISPAIIAAGVMLLLIIAMFASAFMTEPSKLGVPVPGQFGYQAPATEIAEDLNGLTYAYHWVATLITLFVTALLAYACWKFSEKNNPTPQTFTHNTTIEVVWTVVPVLILVAMVYPSIKLLYAQETVPPADLTVKAVGNQWYWDYVYDIDGEEVYVDSYMAGYGYSSYEEMVAGMTAELEEEGITGEALTAAIPTRETWKLAATAPMVVPVDSIIQVQVTATDVLHAWTVPSFGVKVDAVPGRLNQTWFNATKIGTYYGQCSELCGRDHSYMPIEVEVVSREDFPARLAEIKERYASRSIPSEIKLAANSPVFEVE